MNKTAMQKITELPDEYREEKERGYRIVKYRRGKGMVQLI